MVERRSEAEGWDRTGDESLLAGLRAGEPGVLRTLLNRYYEPLRRYAGGIVGQPDDAEEAVQEAFVQLWEKRERWRQDGSLKALLFTLTRNSAIDSFRKKRKEEPLSDARAALLSSSSQDPLEDLCEAELRDSAEQAVNRLPSRRQEVFRLIREGGLSYREVAEILGISNQTVANLMSLALSDLRFSLSRILETAPPPRPRGSSGPPHREVSGSD